MRPQARSRQTTSIRPPKMTTLPHTHESRQPSRVVGYIRSGLSASYPMAGLSISGMYLDGQRQLAGLDIS